jgi:alkylation response protein AidB-like acyl-CoA dehydrogenase
MDFSYTEDQEALRALARQVLTAHATPQRVAEVEAGTERIDRRLWSQLAGAGLLGVCIPEDQGGSGLGIVELCILLEEVGRAVAPVPAFATLALGALPIAEFGSHAQRESLLPGVATGDVILSGALTEPRNPDPLSPQTRAERDGDSWRLDGLKLCVPAASAATVIVVPARLADGGVGIFLVDPRGRGVTLEQVETTNRDLQHLVRLEAAPVPASAVLGQIERGDEILVWLVQRATAGLCAMQVGVVDRALRMTAEYTTSREQFERPLAAFQAVSQRAANAYIDSEGVRLTALAAVWRLAEGLDADGALAVAKFWAAEGAQRVVHAAQHLHGGVGVDLTYPLHRYFLWAKQIELTLGGGTEQLLRIGAILAEDSARAGTTAA